MGGGNRTLSLDLNAHNLTNTRTRHRPYTDRTFSLTQLYLSTFFMGYVQVEESEVKGVDATTIELGLGKDQMKRFALVAEHRSFSHPYTPAPPHFHTFFISTHRSLDRRYHARIARAQILHVKRVIQERESKEKEGEDGGRRRHGPGEWERERERGRRAFLRWDICLRFGHLSLFYFLIFPSHFPLISPELILLSIASHLSERRGRGRRGADRVWWTTRDGSRGR